MPGGGHSQEEQDPGACPTMDRLAESTSAPSIFPHHRWAQLQGSTPQEGGTAQGQVNPSIRFPHLPPSSQQAPLCPCTVGSRHRPTAAQPGEHPAP